MKFTMSIAKTTRLYIDAHGLHDRAQERVVSGIAPFRIPVRNFLLKCMDGVQYVGRRHERQCIQGVGVTLLCGRSGAARNDIRKGRDVLLVVFNLGLTPVRFVLPSLSKR
ncbi:hypothetical protein WJ04_02250 [Burkholderia vietnamiensis]|nr:hypothetical protein WJ04_02250 [Burkholderia vietnamiensis]